MDADEALKLVEQALSDESLGRLQATVFRQAWDELSYQEIAKRSGYEVGYIKQTGSQLWQLLSKALGERVSKGNLQAVLKRYASRVGVGKGSKEWGVGSGGSAGGAGEAREAMPNSQLQAFNSKLQTSNSELTTHNSQLTTYPPPHTLHPTPHTPSYHDWGEASDVSVFYGRSTELTTLERWVLHDQCRLIGLFGMGGIGKTSLSVRLAQQIQDNFEYVIWRSLRNAPPIHTLLHDLTQFVANQQSPALVSETETLDRQILRLLNYLRAHRCLLILDNAETIMQPGDRDGSYQPGYEGYGQLLRCLGETPHQSCLLITSREKPKGLAPKEGDRLPVRSLQLAGLTPDVGRELLSVKGTFSGSASEWQTLVDYYAGNPLALKIVATAIADFFDGSLAQFLSFSQQGGSVFGDIRDLLARQIGRLSDLEQQVMFWLAINREPTRFAELQSDCLPPVSPAHLLETLTALERRSLIEKNDHRFTLQPVVMEYMIERLIEGVCEEVEGVGSGEWGVGNGEAAINSSLIPHPSSLAPHPSSLTPLLRSHALIKAQAKDYVRESQIRLLLKPIVDRLLHTSSRTALDHQLMQIIGSVRGKASQVIGYIGGNVINLLCQLQRDQEEGDRLPFDRALNHRSQTDRVTCTLGDRDFSHLTIWQAYLQKVNLHGTNFSYSDLSKSVFTETFSQILAVAFSPDGKLLAASDISYEVHLWRVADGKKLLTCKANDGWAWSVAFSPDNRLFASSANGTIHLWDVQTGDCVRTLQGHTSRVFSLAFSPTGTYLASGNEDPNIRIWHVATGSLTAVLSDHTDEVHSIAFSPDGALLASGSYDRTIKLWDVSGLRMGVGSGEWGVGSGEGRAEGAMQHSELSSSSAHLRSSSQRASVTQNFIPHPSSPIPHPPSLIPHPPSLIPHPTPHTLTGHIDWIWSVGFSPDGKTLVSSSSDRTIKLWDVRSRQCDKTLLGHAGAVRSLAFTSATGKDANSACLVSGGDDRTVRLWNSNGDCLRVLQGHTSWISAVAFSPDGCLLASGSEDQSVRLWDSGTNQCLRFLQGYNSGVWSIAFSPDGQTLVSGGQDRAIRLWHLSDGRGQKSSPTEPLTTNNQQPTTLYGHTSWIWSVAFSPDGQTVISGSEDGTVRLWDVSEPRTQESGVRTQNSKLAPTPPHAPPPPPNPPKNPPWSVAFSPDGQIIASGSLDGTIRLWQQSVGYESHILKGHEGGVCAIAFSPRSHSRQVFASGSQDQTIRLWALTVQAASLGELTPSLTASTTEVQHLKTLRGHTSWIRCVAFSPDGDLLASGGSDGIVIVWDANTGDRRHAFQAHSSLVLTVAFSPDEPILASSGGDGMIKLWDLSSMTEPAPPAPPCPAAPFPPPPLLQTLQGHQNWVRFLAYSPDGSLLASCSQDGTVKLWDLGAVSCQGQSEETCETVNDHQRGQDNNTSLKASSPYLETLRVQRPYEYARITGVTGLTAAQKDTLRLLGAIEQASEASMSAETPVPHP